jgi:hypothetical protein
MSAATPAAGSAGLRAPGSMWAKLVDESNAASKKSGGARRWCPGRF